MHNNRVTLTFDLYSPQSIHTEPYTTCLLSLVLIAQDVLFSECGHTDPQTHSYTDATDYPTYIVGTSRGAGNKALPITDVL